MRITISLIILLSSSFLVGIIISSPPTRHQVAESAWLTDKLYTNVDALNKDTGCVIYGEKMENLQSGNIIVPKNVMLL